MRSLSDFSVKDMLVSSSVFFGRWSSSFSCHPGQNVIWERPGWRCCPLAGAGAGSLANGPGCGCWVCADELQAQCAEAAVEQSQRAAVRLHQLLPLWRGKSQRQGWQLNLTLYRSETALWIIDNNTTACAHTQTHTETYQMLKGQNSRLGCKERLTVLSLYVNSVTTVTQVDLKYTKWC